MWAFALLGLGAFFLGAAAGFGYARRHPAPVPEAPTQVLHCPGCKRERELPLGLEGKVLVCNQCQLRLRPGGLGPR